MAKERSAADVAYARDLERAVQWFPGHMVRAMREMGEKLKLVDVVVEVVDARVPRSSRNPFLDRVIGERRRVLLLNREDLAEPELTARWLTYYEASGLRAVATCGRDQPSVKRAAAAIAEVSAGVRGIARAMVVGVPNSGKSSIVNGLLRRSAARVENRAGVTRQLQWFRMTDTLEVMDSPGILVPKIPDAQAQWKLALTGAVPRERYDAEEIVARFHAWARERGRDVPDAEAFAAARGFVRRGGVVDYATAARAYVAAFGDGVFGRFTLEEP